MNEPPSQVLKVRSRRPYVWSDGALGVDFDIGPYQVCFRTDWGPHAPSNGQQRVMIQVCRADGGSVIDWRDLQQIKNLVVGEDWEAVELYPSEARLKDPSNARYLWAFKGEAPFGLPGRRMVLDAHEAFAPQRPFPPEAK